MPISHDEIKFSREDLVLRERFFSGKMSLDESLAFYNKVTKKLGYFPYDWEDKILVDNLLINGLNVSNFGRIDHLTFFLGRSD